MLVFVIDALKLFGKGHKTNMSNSCGSESWPSNAAVESCSCLFLACRWQKYVAIHILMVWIVFIAQRQLTPLRSIVISFGLIVFALYNLHVFSLRVFVIWSSSCFSQLCFGCNIKPEQVCAVRVPLISFLVTWFVVSIPKQIS